MCYVLQAQKLPYARGLSPDIMQNEMDMVNCINCELLELFLQSCPKIQRSFFLCVMENFRHVQKQTKSITNPHVLITQILQISIQTILQGLDLYPLPPSYYFKAHLKHYLISSTKISVCASIRTLKKKKTQHNCNTTITPKSLIIIL